MIMSYWKDSLLVGVPQIDNQHRKLVEAIDKLMDACNMGKGRDEIAQTLRFTISYTQEHFRDEENLQQRFAYPAINAHKRLHAQLIMNINEISKEFDRTGPNIGLTAKLNKTLVEWLINHISVEDKKLGEHIQNAK
jgi:hemerythrin